MAFSFSNPNQSNNSLFNVSPSPTTSSIFNAPSNFPSATPPNLSTSLFSQPEQQTRPPQQPLPQSPITRKMTYLLSQLDEHPPSHSSSFQVQQPSQSSLTQEELSFFSTLSGREKISDLPPTLKNKFYTILRKINKDKKHSITIKASLKHSSSLLKPNPIFKLQDQISKLLLKISLLSKNISKSQNFLFSKIYELTIIFNNYRLLKGCQSPAINKAGNLNLRECQNMINSIMKEYVNNKDEDAKFLRKEFERVNEIFLLVNCNDNKLKENDKENEIKFYVEEFCKLYNLVGNRIKGIENKGNEVKEKFVGILDKAKINCNSPFVEYEKSVRKIRKEFENGLDFSNIEEILLELNK